MWELNPSRDPSQIPKIPALNLFDGITGSFSGTLHPISNATIPINGEFDLELGLEPVADNMMGGMFNGLSMMTHMMGEALMGGKIPMMEGMLPGGDEEMMRYPEKVASMNVGVKFDG